MQHVQFRVRFGGGYPVHNFADLILQTGDFFVFGEPNRAVRQRDRLRGNHAVLKSALNGLLEFRVLRGKFLFDGAVKRVKPGQIGGPVCQKFQSDGSLVMLIRNIALRIFYKAVHLRLIFGQVALRKVKSKAGFPVHLFQRGYIAFYAGEGFIGCGDGVFKFLHAA